MTIYKSTKRVLLAVSICLLVAATVFVISTRGSRRPQPPQPPQPPPRQNQTNNDKIALRDALRREGLRGAARLKGNYIEEVDPHWHSGQFTLEALTKNSAAVIVGRFTKRLNPRLIEGKAIYTDYEVAVDEVVKGNLKPAHPIVVSLAGGRVHFEDGTSAEQTTPTVEPIRMEHSYALFLREQDALPSIFVLMGGPQGAVDISDSSTVRSHGRSDDRSVVETKSKDRDSFLKDIRDNARKWPKPGKCCG